jgi:hypothetical protein
MNNILLKRFGVIIIIILIYILVSKKIFHKLENKSEVFYKNLKIEQNIKIYDIIHHNLPSMRHLSVIVEAIPFIIIAIVFFIDLKLFYNLSGLLITIIIFRMFIIHFTILPKDKKCDIKNSSVYNGGCYDKVYSGHFASVLICLLILYKNKYINIFTLVFLSMVMAFLLILTRAHYTIDIVVAFLVVWVVYQNNINLCRVIDKFVK